MTQTTTKKTKRPKAEMQRNARTAQNPLGGGRRKGVTMDELQGRLDVVEALLIRRVSESTIHAHCRKTWGLAERQSRSYVGKVRARWRAEAEAAGTREQQRDHMRRSLEDLYSRSMTVSATKPDPDTRSASRAAKLLIDLDALNAPPPTQQINVTAAVGAAVAPTDAAGLASFLTRLAAPADGAGT